MSAFLSRYKNILIVCLIFFLFLSPLWLADWVYYKGSYLITKTTNHGTLLTPPLDLKQIPLTNLQGATFDFSQFQNQWVLLAITPSVNADSLKKAYEIRQIRLMLGKNMNKIQRMLLFYRVKAPIALPSEYTSLYAGTLFAIVDEKNWLQLFKSSQLQQKSTILNGFFIVDSRGQLIMRYPVSVNPKDIMQDLKRLVGGAY